MVPPGLGPRSDAPGSSEKDGRDDEVANVRQVVGAVAMPKGQKLQHGRLQLLLVKEEMPGLMKAQKVAEKPTFSTPPAFPQPATATAPTVYSLSLLYPNLNEWRGWILLL